MRFVLSLRWFLGLTFLLLALSLVAGYSMLSADYFLRGMDNITALQMEKAAQEYLEKTPQSQRQKPYTVLGYTVFPHWQQVPETIRHQAISAPEQSNELIKIFNGNRPVGKHSIDFLFHYTMDSDSVYVTFRISPDTVSAMVESNSRANRQKLIMTSVSTALALSLIIWLLMRRISQPVNRLVDWTGNLDSDNLKASPPDFTYPELNQLALLIRKSLSSVQDSLDREHRFLRHTSHELRTPISVIRNNVELLRKLQRNGQDQNEQQQQVIERLDRSSLTMKHLTETLLWLSRDSAEDLPTTEVTLDELITQLAGDMQYLLKEKPVELVLDTETYRAVLPESVVRIVAGNLIRNAFQHTWEGSVIIRQRGSSIEITNPSEEEYSEDDLGFGLGLKLTEQLCEKLHWEYRNATRNSIRRATIIFRS